MQTYHYKTEQFLPININKAWNFFSSAKNLAIITPPEMKFNILTDLDDKGIYEGMIIDYTVRPLLNVPLHWQTEIFQIKAPSLFTDRQLKGPFRLWEHSHFFIEKDHGVLMKDHVKYQMPMGIMGKLAHALIVRKKIEGIFNFRKGVLKRLF